MKAVVLAKLLGKRSPMVQIAVPCGIDDDGQVLYTDKIRIQEMVTSEATGIDPDGSPASEEVPVIMLLPEDGPWGDMFNGIGEEEEDEEEDDSEDWKKT